MTSSNRSRLSALSKLLLMGLGGTILTALLVLIGLLGASDRFWGAVVSWLRPTVSEPQVELPTLVVERIRGASELTTAIFAMEAIVPAQQDRRLGNFTVGSTRLLYIAHGEVRAGVDLSALDPSDIEVSPETIIVRLPPPRLLDRKIDVERSRIYDYERGWLGPDVGPQLQTRAARETLKRVVGAACDRGILQEANTRAEFVVGRLLKLDARRVEVVTTEPASDTCS